MSEYTRDGNGLTSTAVSNVRMVYLVSQDGEAFQVPISVARWAIEPCKPVEYKDYDYYFDDFELLSCLSVMISGGLIEQLVS